MSVFYAASFLSHPVIYKNGDLAGVCKEIAFSSRLNKMTGLIVYDRKGQRRFLAARYIASQGYDAVILKTGAVLTEPTGSFPLGRLAYRSDGKPLSRMKDAALDEKRNVLFFTLTSGESYPPSAVIKSADPAVVFGQTDAPSYQKRRYVRKKTKQSADFSAAPAEAKTALSDETERHSSPNFEPPETTITEIGTASNEAPAAEINATPVAAAMAETLPATESNVVPTAVAPAEKLLPVTGAATDPLSAADCATETLPATDSLPKASPGAATLQVQNFADGVPQAQTPEDDEPQAQTATDVTAKPGTSRPTAPMLYTLPGAGFTLPERVADGRSLLGRVMKADLYARGGVIILRAGERVTPAAVTAAAHAGLTVDLVRKSRPALF